jgi:hypothetical protein
MFICFPSIKFFLFYTVELLFLCYSYIFNPYKSPFFQNGFFLSVKRFFFKVNEFVQLRFKPNQRIVLYLGLGTAEIICGDMLGLLAATLHVQGELHRTVRTEVRAGALPAISINQSLQYPITPCNIHQSLPAIFPCNIHQSLPAISQYLQYPTITPCNIHQSLPAISTNQSLQYPSITPCNIHQPLPAISINHSLQYSFITPCNIHSSLPAVSIKQSLQYPFITPCNIHLSLPAISINHSQQYPSITPCNIHQSLPALSINHSSLYPSSTSCNMHQSLPAIPINHSLQYASISPCNIHQSLSAISINHSLQYPSITPCNIHQSLPATSIVNQSNTIHYFQLRLIDRLDFLMFKRSLKIKDERLYAVIFTYSCLQDQSIRVQFPQYPLVIGSLVAISINQARLLINPSNKDALLQYPPIPDGTQFHFIANSMYHLFHIKWEEW